MAAGLGVTEFNDEGAAAAEIRRLWLWVKAQLEGSAMPKQRRIVLSGVVTAMRERATSPTAGRR
jgi:hypothetical protein